MMLLGLLTLFGHLILDYPHTLADPLFLLFCAFACITLQFSRITIAQREMFQVRFEYCFLFFKPEKSNAFYQRQDG